MTITMNGLNADPWPEVGAVVEPLHCYPVPRTSIDGVSFATPCASSSILKRLITTSVVAVGTISVSAAACQRVPDNLNFAIVLPASLSDPEALSSFVLAQRYEAIRQQMVQAGLPQLDDEGVRREIAERKGVKPGLDS